MKQNFGMCWVEYSPVRVLYSLRNSRPETVIVQDGGAVKFNLIQLSQVSKYVECTADDENWEREKQKKTGRKKGVELF
jgi:hypothetical protein